MTKPVTLADLTEAATAYTDAATAYEAYCEDNGVYSAAQTSSIAFRRQTRIPAFATLQERIDAALSDPHSTTAGRNLIESAQRIKAILSDDRSTVFTAAATNYTSLGYTFRGPDIRTPLATFIHVSQQYEAMLARQNSFDGLFDAMFNFGPTPPSGRRPRGASVSPGMGSQ